MFDNCGKIRTFTSSFSKYCWVQIYWGDIYACFLMLRLGLGKGKAHSSSPNLDDARLCHKDSRSRTFWHEAPYIAMCL